MRAFAAVVPAVLALALVAASGGCGGGTSRADETRYVEAVNQAQDGFARTLDRLSTSITARQDRRTLRSFARAVDAAVVELRRVSPPGRVKDLHGRLVAQVASYGRPIATARSAFAMQDPRLIIAAQGRFVGAVTRTGERVNRTIAAINERLRS